MKLINLNGIWSVRPDIIECIGLDGLKLTQLSQDNWINSQVPGEIHLDLIREGQMSEPSVSNNMPACRWPETKSWWYKKTFEIGEDFLKHERQTLVFDGLDLYAQVFLNDKLVGESKDAFVPKTFAVKQFLNIGQNELVVRLTAGSELAMDDTQPGQDKPEHKPSKAFGGAIPNPQQENDLYGHRGWNGKKWLRKPQFMYGWDWVDALPNIGIWRSVRLEARSYAVISDIRLDSFVRGSEVFIEMEAILENMHPYSERFCKFELTVIPPDGTAAIHRSYTLDMIPGRIVVSDIVMVPSAKLWWPNGMGEQPLYEIKATLTDPDERICDSLIKTIGLRTVKIERSRLVEGSRFCFKINRQVVFCKGANIGPFDVIPARITDNKYETLISEAKNANMNMLRINGCSIYESETFYNACDKAGIMIWQDFMMTDSTYPEEDEGFSVLLRNETEIIIKLLKHHPSIVLWCGNNECQQIFDIWNPDKNKPLDIGGQKFYNQVFPDICRYLDPRRPYWPGSPCGGVIADSEISGDTHWWYGAFFSSDMERRIKPEVFDECRARFVSEYGIIGPCHLDSINEYLTKEEMDQKHLTWKMHENMCDKGAVLSGIRRYYKDPEKLTIPEYVLYGQMFQAIMHSAEMEALRFRKNDPVDDCQGALIWSYSDCWGETGWSILDYYLRRKVSYYWFKRATKPIKIIVRQRGDRFITRMINDTLLPISGRVEIGWWKLDGGDKETESKLINAQPNSMCNVTMSRIHSIKNKDPHQWIYAAILIQEDGLIVDQSVLPLVTYRDLNISLPQIKAIELENGWLEVSSSVFSHAVHVEDFGYELISDNWFDLLPNVPVRIQSNGNKTFDDIDFNTVI